MIRRDRTNCNVSISILNLTRKFRLLSIKGWEDSLNKRRALIKNLIKCILGWKILRRFLIRKFRKGSIGVLVR